MDTISVLGVWLISAGLGVLLGSLAFGLVGALGGFMLWPAFFYGISRITNPNPSQTNSPHNATSTQLTK